MKVIRVNTPGNLEIQEVSKPEKLAPQEVLVKVKAAGICGSDIHIYHGTSPVATYPRVLGHEVVGEIAEVGSEVDNLKVGDHVAIDPVVSCGECYPCRIGRNNVCKSLKVRGVHTDGGFAEYVAVPSKSVYQILKDIPWAEAAMIEPFTIGAQILKRGEITGDDTVLILGAGPIGLISLQVAKLVGAKVIITDLLDKRLAVAKELGAEVTINTGKEDLKEIVFKETDGLGVTVVVEAVGLPHLLEEAAQITSPAGRIVVLGFTDAPSKLAQLHITKNELDIRGSRLHANQFPTVIKWFNNKEVNPSVLISHKFPFSEIASAIKLIENDPQNACKVVLLFD